MNLDDFRQRLSSKGLKVTPQRIALYEAISGNVNHPDAETIYITIKRKHPNISQGTVYKNLETLVEHNVIKKIKTDTGKMRFESYLDHHHHLYCEDTDRISDYEDNELDQLLENYFKNKNIPGFKISDIKLQIVGQFDKKQ
jgi:Fur family peroxide stress response transcriptional regulator